MRILATMSVNIAAPPPIKALRIGVRVNPAAISLLYETGDGKRRLRLMPIRGLVPYGPVALQVAELRHRHTHYLEQVIITFNNFSVPSQ